MLTNFIVVLRFPFQRDTLTQKVEELTAKTEQLSGLLRSLQQAHVQPVQPSLPAPGAIGAQSFRIAGPGALQRFNSNVRVMGPVAAEGELTGVTPKGYNLRASASFRMGGKPPMPLSPAGVAVPVAAVSGGGVATPPHGGPASSGAAEASPNALRVAGAALPPPVVPVGGLAALNARTPFLFSGGGTIQRNRPSAGTSHSSPYPPSSPSPVNNASQSTSLSSSPDASYNDLTVLARAASPQDTSAKDTGTSDGSGDSEFFSPLARSNKKSSKQAPESTASPELNADTPLQPETGLSGIAEVREEAATD
jgi:hypothetical protein